MADFSPTRNRLSPMDRLRLIRALIRGWQDPDEGFELTRRVGGVLAPRYRFKWPQMAWWDDEWFSEFLVRFDEHELNADRRWMLAQLIRLVDEVPGETAECGVFRGAGSFLICSANRRSRFGRTHFMFDSFQGLSAPEPSDGDYWSEGDLAATEDDVRQALAEFPQISLHPGWIPTRFDDVADRRFCFVHVDVDLYEPTRDGIEFFYPRLNPGGILVCDDFGLTSCPGATKAVDEFLRDKPEAMVALADGGGFMIKDCVTATEPGLPPSA